jgi:hypothetical protein
MSRLTPEQSREWNALGDDPLAASRLMSRWAFEDIAARPWATFRGIIRKLEVVVFAELSPARSHVANVGYALCYAPIHLLALFGLCRRDPRQVGGLVVLLLTGFLLVTAVYWAHTSHTSIVDALLFVMASAAVVRMTGGAGRPGPETAAWRTRA